MQSASISNGYLGNQKQSSSKNNNYYHNNKEKSPRRQSHYNNDDNEDNSPGLAQKNSKIKGGSQAFN